MKFEVKSDLPFETQKEIDLISDVASSQRTTRQAAIFTSYAPYLTNEIITKDSAGLVVLAAGNTVPTSYPGFRKGSLFIKKNATSACLYINQGDETTAVWGAVSDSTAISLGGLSVKSLSVQKTLTNARTNVISVQVPAGAKLISAVLKNDTAVAGLDDATGLTPITTYAALYSTGATQSLGASIVVAINTTTKKMFDENAATSITSGLTDVTVDAGSGKKFTAGGKITATVYYFEL